MKIITVISTLAVFTVISMIVSVPFDHYDTFVI